MNGYHYIRNHFVRRSDCTYIIFYGVEMGIIVLFYQKIHFKIICVHIDRFIPIYTQSYITSTIYIEFRPFYTFQAEIVRMIDSEYIILYWDHFSRIPLYTYISFDGPSYRPHRNQNKCRGAYSALNRFAFRSRPLSFSATSAGILFFYKRCA